MNPRTRAFILRHTRLQQPPLLPELRLYLADEVVPIWREVESELARADAPPYWAFAWVGGQAIARYVLDHPARVRGKRVLDFASGSGLCAVATMKAGASHVLAVDIDPFSADAVPLNADANDVSLSFTDENLLDGDPPPVDVILAGDICYEQPTADRALSWLRAAHEHGSDVLIGDPGRIYFRADGLTRLAEYLVPATREVEDRDVKPAAVFTFAPAE